MQSFLLAISLVSLLIWLVLLIGWGQFWRCNQRITKTETQLTAYPSVVAIVPARNEAEVIATSMRSLLVQDYPGDFTIILIDDGSTDNTAQIATETATQLNQQRLKIISGQPLPVGWTGKLWAIEQGIRYCNEQNLESDYFLLTDADIEHHQKNLTELVTLAETKNLALVSLMVLLHCQSWWEKLLIPAFVFFFQKLYPFSWVNDRINKMAAAAGGCILIRRQELQQIGGIKVLRQALIDDCTLARKVKSQSSNGIWLGLTDSTRSLRTYNSLKPIWDMVARTAYTQLNYSFWLLLGTVSGMIIVYLAAPIGAIAGILSNNWLLAGINLLTWLLMAVAYFPTIKLYDRPFFWALALPAIAFLYTLMTIDSALRHWQGKGGNWKGRVYSN